MWRRAIFGEAGPPILNEGRKFHSDSEPFCPLRLTDSVLLLLRQPTICLENGQAYSDRSFREHRPRKRPAATPSDAVDTPSTHIIFALRLWFWVIVLSSWRRHRLSCQLRRHFNNHHIAVVPYYVLVVPFQYAAASGGYIANRFGN